MKIRRHGSFRLTLGAMMTVLTVISVYLSAILPSGKISLLFLSGIFLIPLLYEREVGGAVLIYIASAILSLLLVPGMINAVPYILFFGHYGIGKYLCEEKKNRLLSFIFKFIYYNVFMFACYFLFFDMLAGEFLKGIPFILLLLMMEVFFFVYDYLYSGIITLYGKKIKRLILG
ncbi:MAG: hypothetical protein II749_00255 [Clostridia bacterium]|nr:hypothetical protein [Clostridia bacterium]